MSANRYEGGLPAVAACGAPACVDLASLFYSLFSVQTAVCMVRYLRLRLLGQLSGQTYQALEERVQALAGQAQLAGGPADLGCGKDVHAVVCATKIFGTKDARL